MSTAVIRQLESKAAAGMCHLANATVTIGFVGFGKYWGNKAAAALQRIALSCGCPDRETTLVETTALPW